MAQWYQTCRTGWSLSLAQFLKGSPVGIPLFSMFQRLQTWLKSMGCDQCQNWVFWNRVHSLNSGHTSQNSICVLKEELCVH